MPMQRRGRYHALAKYERWFCVANVLRCLCLSWVISRHYAPSGECRLYPRKRNLPKSIGVSAKCQKQTYGRLNRSTVACRCARGSGTKKLDK
jgi:hypothetical protein